AVGALAKGAHPLKPGVKPMTEIGMDADLRERIRLRLGTWLARLVARRYGPLAGHAPAEPRGAARGGLYQLAEALGTRATRQPPAGCPRGRRARLPVAWRGRAGRRRGRPAPASAPRRSTCRGFRTGPR